MKVSEFYLKSEYDDLNISVLLAEPDSAERIGIVQIAHGMSEHKERYLHLIDFLTTNGYVCIINDHRGHGKSIKNVGDYGYFYEGGFNAMIEDLHLVTKFIKEKFPDLSLHLIGHSMGSLAVRYYTKKYDNELSSLTIVGSPSYNKLMPIGKCLCRIYSFIFGGYFRSRLLHKLSLDANNKNFKNENSHFAWLTCDEEIRKLYETDPLCGFHFTANGYNALYSLMGEVYNKNNWNLKNTKLKIKFLSGEDDPCMIDKKHFDSSVNFLKEVGYINCSSNLYKEMRHEILSGKGSDIVYQDLINFLRN